MIDAILPPRAGRAEEVCQLISAALSDGDLDAALLHYAPTAVTAPGDGRELRGREAIREMLAAAAAARLLYTVEVTRTLEIPGLALVVGRWTSAGSRRDGAPLRQAGRYSSVVRQQSDGTWQIAIETIETTLPADAYAVPSAHYQEDPS